METGRIVGWTLAGFALLVFGVAIGLWCAVPAADWVAGYDVSDRLHEGILAVLFWVAFSRMRRPRRPVRSG